MEKAIAAPLTGEEIIEVACSQFRDRLRGLSPLQLNKEYAGFEITFENKIRLFGLGANNGTAKETLAWGSTTVGEKPAGAEVTAVDDKGEYKSGDDVNAVRLDHELPLHVETGDGKGGKVVKKVRHKVQK